MFYCLKHRKNVEAFPLFQILLWNSPQQVFVDESPDVVGDNSYAVSDKNVFNHPDSRYVTYFI